MFDLNAIFESLTGVNNQRAQAAQQEAANQAAATDAVASAGQSMLGQSRQLIADKTALAGQENEIDVIRNELVQHYQRVAGLDPNDMNNEFVQSIAEMNAAEERRKQVRAEINTLSGATMLGDPINWLIGQMKLPQLVAENNAAVDERDAAVKNLQTRQSLLNTQKSVVVANTVEQSKRVGVERVRIAAEEANLRLMAEESKLGADIAARRLNEYRLRDTALQMQGNNLETAIKIEDIQAQRQMRQLQYTSMIEQRNAQLADKNEKAAAEAEVNLQLQRVAKFFGLPENITIQQLKLMPLTPAQKETLGNAARTGMLGKDMGDTLVNILGFDGALPAIQRDNPLLGQVITQSAETVARYADTISSKAQVTGRKFKKGELEAEAFDEYEADIKNAALRRGYAKPMNSSAWDTTFNPLKVNHKLMLNVIDEGRAKFLQENQFVSALKTVSAFTPPEARDLRGEDETKALQVMVERVKKREIPPAEAARQITEYYNAGRYINADLTKYGILGLPIPDAYHVTLPSSGIWGKPQSANLLNAADVERMLVEGARNQMAASMAPYIQKLVPAMAPGLGAATGLNPGISGLPGIDPKVTDFLRGYKQEDAK